MTRRLYTCLLDIERTMDVGLQNAKLKYSYVFYFTHN